MTRTQVLQEIRRMRFKEAYERRSAWAAVGLGWGAPGSGTVRTGPDSL